MAGVSLMDQLLRTLYNLEPIRKTKTGLGYCKSKQTAACFECF